MKLLVTGGWRTGSTVAYMLARRLFDMNGLGRNRGGVDAYSLHQFLDQPGGWVLKAHNVYLPPREGLRIVWCSRAGADALGSWLRVGGRKAEGVRQLHVSYALARAYHAEPRPDVLFLDYARCYLDPAERVRELSKHILGAEPSPEDVAALVNAHDPALVKSITDAIPEADSETELRPRHVGPLLGAPGSYPPSLWSEL